MATAHDIIVDARAMLGIDEAEEPLQDYEAQRGLTALNDMLQQWVLEKTIMSAPRLDSLTETVSVDTYGFSSITDEGNEAFKACLAVRLGPKYGKQADAATVALCTNGKEAITNASFDPDSVAADSDLPKMPSQRLVDY